MRTVDSILASKLLQLKSPAEVEDFLREIAGIGVMSDEASWRPVGAQRSNAGAIEVSADEINPLVERVVNGMESVVDLKFTEWRKSNPNATIPSSPKEAIERIFNIPKGLTRVLSEEQAKILADQVQLILRGDREQPTVVVVDQGIGIHPDDFASTVLSLGQSEKGQKPYLIGMYGQGGSSTFEKCEYTVIVSRRHPSHLLSSQSDLAGWTVVRRHLATRSHVYSYLVDPATGAIPFFPGQIAEQCGLKHGTRIAHISYKNLGGFATQAITNNAWYSLNFRLFDPLLPWTLIEERQMPVRGSRTMRGVPYRVAQLPQTEGIGIPKGGKTGETAVRHHILFDYNDASYGMIQVEWWVFQDEQVNEGLRRRAHAERIAPYVDRHRRYARRHVAITRGGQMHAALTQSVFEQARLRQVARSVVVNVNTDGLTFEAGASFFSSNRADLKTQSQEVVEQAISAAIEAYRDELRAIERERQEEIVHGRGAADEDAIRSRLDRLIKNFTRAQSGRGTSTQKPTEPESRFHGRVIPTYLRFARSEQLSLRPGLPTRIDILTDASDKTVTSKHTGKVFQANNDLLGLRLLGGGNGRWQIEVRCSVDAPIGLKAEITASMEHPGVWRVVTEQPCKVEVVPPPPPYVGVDPPTFFRIRSRQGEVHVRQGGARVSIETNSVDNLFDHGELQIQVPPLITVIGNGHPRKGDIRVNLGIPPEFPIGEAGEIRAELRLADGILLSDSAMLMIDAHLKEAGESGSVDVPNYKIIDVREQPSSDKEDSWASMAGITQIETEWRGDDVGGFTVGIGEGENERKLVFYLNADNREIQRAERQITERRSETSIDAVRQYHRTLLCYYLYQMANPEGRELRIQDGNDGDNPVTPPDRVYRDYREEMVRLNRTLLFAQREFYESLIGFEAEGDSFD